MISRRALLRSCLGTCAIGTLRVPWPAAEHAFSSEVSKSEAESELVRLDANENPYGPSRRVLDALALTNSNLSRYPGQDQAELAQLIAQFHQRKPEAVLLGCGSTEILRVAAFAFAGTDKPVIQASPTFEAMGRYAETAGAEVRSLRLTPAFAHDLDRMLAEANRAPSLVYICNPNNPTASLTPRQDIEQFLQKLSNHSVVLIDEAYHEYAGESGMYGSFVEQTLHDDRLVVTRTFSIAYGLAGLRVGYAVGSPKLIQRMREFITADSLNAVAAKAAAIALQDKASLRACVERNSDDRQEFFNQAMARQVKPIASHANFVMMNTFHPAEEVIADFRQKNVLLGRRFEKMNTYIRVSLGTPDDMAAFWRVWDQLPYTKNLMPH